MEQVSDAATDDEDNDSNPSPAPGKPQTMAPILDRRIISCLNCRVRHRKCDDRANRCLQCESAQLKCVGRADLRFQLVPLSNKFPRGQQWIEISERVIFVGEDHILEDLSPRASDIPNETMNEGGETGSAALVLLDDTALQAPDSEAVESPPTASCFGAATLSSGPFYDLLTNSDSSHSHTPSTALPLRIINSSEAHLFQYFLDTLLVWFDFDDPQQIFRRDVIQVSGNCEILLQAVYALASRQLSNLGHFEPSAADKYHETCMRTLIQALEPSSSTEKDHLFAATVILRTKEEFDTTWHGSDFEAHLLGIKTFTHSAWFDQEPSPLRRRLYWIALRQEISFALTKHRPLDIELDLSFTKEHFDISTEAEWAKCASLNLAQIIVFAFDDQPKTGERYDRLRRATHNLAAALPFSFQPFYESSVVEERDELALPQVLISSNLGCFSTQHLIISQLFLNVFNPTIVHIGPGSYHAAQKRTSDVVELLRRLCGIGISQSKFGPCMILACVGASICGDRLNDERQKEAVMDILVRTESEHAYPTAAIQQGLLEAWSAS